MRVQVEDKGHLRKRKLYDVEHVEYSIGKNIVELWWTGDIFLIPMDFSFSDDSFYT